MMAGLRIIESVYAVKASDERLFPRSRYRSPRVHKKLLKRFGGEYRMIPAAFQTRDTMIVHPVIMRQLQSELAVKWERTLESALFAGLRP